YINVVSTAPDQSGILSNEVKFFIGEAYYTVTGTTVSMDVAPYISTLSNSTLVPARFLGNSLGIDDSAITWDDVTKTATFIAPSKVIQFQLNNSNMIINGTSVPMLSPDGKPVTAEIKDSRIFVPLRAFGIALGVSVDWEADTQTAIYNKGVVA
ncbi:MAG: copper amine oxidase N-terminal domain-containing protein, partial [Clostridiales bacterium]|nr:copper amine oxidase N-terminal domain-containing protein [Clostridiales bacterium]